MASRIVGGNPWKGQFFAVGHLVTLPDGSRKARRGDKVYDLFPNGCSPWLRRRSRLREVKFSRIFSSPGQKSHIYHLPCFHNLLKTVKAISSYPGK
jgi:hypothetical protein